MPIKKVFIEESVLKCPQCTFNQSYFKDSENICTICNFKYDFKEIKRHIETRKEYIWNCQKCTYENKVCSTQNININNLCCQLCHFNSFNNETNSSKIINKKCYSENIVNDDDVVVTNDTHLENKIETKWVCKLCTFENISSFNHCLVCQHLKDAEIDYNQISNDWKTAESYRAPVNCNRCLQMIYQKLNDFTKQKKINVNNIDYDITTFENLIDRQIFPRMTCHYKTIQIELLAYEDTLLNRWYDLTKKQLGEKGQEKIGFHGTTFENIPYIYQNGFSLANMGQNGLAYGKGIYVGKNSTIPAQERYSKEHSKIAWILIVKIIYTNISAYNYYNRNEMKEKINNFEITSINNDAWLVPREAQVVPIGIACISRNRF